MAQKQFLMTTDGDKIHGVMAAYHSHGASMTVFPLLIILYCRHQLPAIIGSIQNKELSTNRHECDLN